MPISNPSNQFANSQFVVDPTLGVGSYQTIAAALAAAPSGATIYIRPGIYTEDLIADLGGKTIIGATVGTNAFSVQIVGNHIFDEDAETCAFQSVGFSASAGAAWTVGSAGAGNSSLYLEGCSVANSGGIAIQVASAGGTGSVQSFFTGITGSTTAIDAANGTMRLESGTVTGSAGNALAIGAAMAITASNMNFNAAAGDCVTFSDASASLDSEISTYVSSLAAFHFTADGTLTSISDRVNSSNPSGLFVDSTGAFGNLDYASLILIGSATGIDSQVTATALSVISSSGLVTESITLNQTLQANHRYFVTAGALSLALPAMSTVGDTIIVRLRGGTSWVINQGAGQQIFFGNQNSTLGAGGSLASTAAGDSITLICSDADLAWSAEASIGNLTVV